MPKVTVVIPVYNIESYLEECIQSILTQTLKDIEVICVDDGSTDGSFAKLKEYEQRDTRVRVFQQENKFAGAARNLGLDHATGDYVIFMDGDDFYPSCYVLELLYTKAIENEVQICGGSRVHYRDGKIVKPEWNSKEFFSEDKLMKFSEYQFDFNHQRYLFNRKFLLDNNLRYRDYARCQDAPFLLEAMIKADIFYAVKDDVYCYRWGHQNIKWNSRTVNDLLKGLTENLIRSRDAGLNELHQRVAERITKENNVTVFVDSYNEGNHEVFLLLNNFVNAMDPSIVKNKCRSNAQELLGTVYLSYLKDLGRKDYAVNPKNSQDKKKSPKITVALPVYNVEKYLRECLNSVVNQTFDDIEILCINDASTDNSLQIVQEYAATDDRFVIIDKEHEGLSVSRNIAIEAARGEFIYFLDCDDFMALNTLEAVYEIATNDNLDILYFDGIVVFENESLEMKYPQYHGMYQKQCPASEILTGQQLLVHYTHKNFKVQMCMQFIRVDFLRQEGIRCYPGLIHQDELFSSMCIVAASRVRYIKESFFYRRIREDSTITAIDLALSFHSIMTVTVSFLRFIENRQIETEARSILFAKMKNWTNRAYDRHKEIKDSVNIDDVFAGDNLKHYIFSSIVTAPKGKRRNRDSSSEALKAVENSVSFKIGRAITWLPRKIRGIITAKRAK